MSRAAGLGPEEALAAARAALQKAGVGAWELYLSREETLVIEIKEQAVESLQAAIHSGLAARLIESGRMGFSYTSDLSPPAVAEMVDRARASAKEVSEDPLFSVAGDDPAPLPELDIFDSERKQRPESAKIERAKALEAAALAFDPRVKKVRKAEYQEVESEIFLWTSAGLVRRGRSTLYTGSLGALAEQDGDSQMAWELDFARSYDKLDAAVIGRLAAEQAVGLLGAKPISSRRCPMVLLPEPAADLLGVLAEAASAEAVAKQKSWLADQIGRAVLARTVSVVDDGLLASAPGAFPFDGEGERCRRTLVVEEGTLRSFLYDRYHGRKLGAVSTGNSQRDSFTQPPAVGANGFHIPPGRASKADLLGRLSRGALVEQLMGVHLADEVTGEFSVGCTGHLVEAGRLGAPFTGVVLSGQLGQLFSRVEEVGSDLRFFGGVGSPSLLVGEVALSGR